MDILYSSISDLSEPSAGRTHISEIVNNFAKLGHKVHLIALDKGDLILHTNVRFYKIFPFINKRFLSLATLTLQKNHIKYLIKRIVKKENIDLIYERHGEDYATEIGVKKNIPTILELNGVASAEAKLQSADKKEIEKIDATEIKKIQMADKIVAVTERIKEHYVTLGVNENKFVVMPNGVNTDIFRPLDEEMCRRELDLGRFPIIAFVGSFRPYQGLEFAISAMPLILKEIPNAKLLLVGDAGNYRGFQFRPTIQDLKSLAEHLGVEKNVIFTGRVKYEKIPLYINSSDVCLIFRDGLPEGYGSPVKLFEYLACSRPVICTDWKMFKFIEQEKVGFLVNHKNPTNIAQAIIKLLDNKKLCREMGERGRKLAIREADWNLIAQKIICSIDNKI
jgi:glycosyltransferase involved in cell wall biosynthesis